MAALEALLGERLESDRQDEEALKALGQAEAAKRDEAQKTLSRQLLVKTSTRNKTEEHADNYKPQDDDGMQGDEPQDDDGIQDDEAQKDKLQEDEDGRYPMFQKENDSDVDDNSGVVPIRILVQWCVVLQLPLDSIVQIGMHHMN
jgi:hypothetical protein